MYEAAGCPDSLLPEISQVSRASKANADAGKDDADTCILDSVEVFDPAIEKWSLMSPMMDCRYVFQMVMLSNGTCMAIGGTSTAGFTATTETFTMQL